jgi:type IV pilus assembly protein PilC
MKISLDWFLFISLREKVAFAKNMGAMLSAGLPLARALQVLERQSESAAFRKVVIGLGEEVRRGHTLSQAIRRYPRVFSKLFSAVVSVGEEGGTLAASLSSLSEQLERVYALGKKVRGALLYPAFIVVVMAAIAVLMLIYVVPELSATFAEFQVSLPASTQVLIMVSNFFSHHLLLFISALGVVVVGVVLFFRTRIGGKIVDFALLHAPVLRTLVREVNTARVARTLGSLTAAGVPITTSLDVASQVVQNGYYRRALSLSRGSIEKGKTLSVTLGEFPTLFEPYIVEMVASGEETGKLGDLLLDTALFYEAEVEQKTKNFSSVIEPFLMVAVGVAVGFFAYAMILPMYTVMNAL